MPQPFIEVSHAWRLVTRKHDGVNPTALWTNTWCIYRPGDTDPPDITSELFTHIADFEIFMLYAPCVLQDYLLYPWQYGMSPSGPTPPIAVETVNALGEIPATNTSPAWQGGGATGANVVQHIKLVRTSGPRNGKHLFRAGLQRSDITSTGAGEPWTLSNAGSPTLIPTVVNAQAVTLLGDAFQGGPGFEGNYLGLVHTHKSGGFIETASVGGVSAVIWDAVTGLQRRQRSGT